MDDITEFVFFKLMDEIKHIQVPQLIQVLQSQTLKMMAFTIIHGPQSADRNTIKNNGKKTDCCWYGHLASCESKKQEHECYPICRFFCYYSREA